MDHIIVAEKMLESKDIKIIRTTCPQHCGIVCCGI